MNMHKMGYAHDKFIVLGKHSFTEVSKLKQTRSFKVDPSYVSTKDAYCPDEKTYAKNALYKDEFYEGGPLARAMSSNNILIKNIHRSYKDSAYTRVMARVLEIGTLLKKVKTLISGLDLSEESFYSLPDIEKVNASGMGIVEAPRGPLIHKVILEQGKIVRYEIITPTQWNLGSSVQNNLSPSQQAMKGASMNESLFIFRSFDVCSVCTTH